MNLTPHFTLEELSHSDTAEAKGIDNTAPPGVVDRLTILAQGLEAVRALLGAPLRINSGYRCPQLNKAVGGVSNSAHLDGYAADFTCAAFGTPLEIVRKVVASNIKFDQIIQEGTWVHISFAPPLRRNTLTAHFGPNGATYTAGA